MKKITLILTIVLLLGNYSLPLASQQTKPKNCKRNTTKIVKSNKQDTIKQEIVKKDTTAKLEDRDIVFDLKRLNLMASLSVYGQKDYEGSGRVVVAVDIDEEGLFRKLEIKESTNKKLNLPAIKVIQEYGKKYNIQAAVKNGVPVYTEDLIVPVEFDMDRFKD